MYFTCAAQAVLCGTRLSMATSLQEGNLKKHVLKLLTAFCILFPQVKLASSSPAKSDVFQALTTIHNVMTCCLCRETGCSALHVLVLHQVPKQQLRSSKFIPACMSYLTLSSALVPIPAYYTNFLVGFKRAWVMYSVTSLLEALLINETIVCVKDVIMHAMTTLILRYFLSY